MRKGSRVHYNGDRKDTGTIVEVRYRKNGLTTYLVKWDDGSTDNQGAPDLRYIYNGLELAIKKAKGLV